MYVCTIHYMQKVSYIYYGVKLQAFNKQFRLYYYWSKPQLSPRYICIPTSIIIIIRTEYVYVYMYSTVC